MDASELPTMHGYRVHPTKRGYAEELFATCRRLRVEKNGRPDLRGLARHIHLGGENTLIAELQSAGDPHLDTLRRLAVFAALPLARSLLALGVTADELGQPAIDSSGVALSTWHARLCPAVARLSPTRAAQLLPIVADMLRAQADDDPQA